MSQARLSPPPGLSPLVPPAQAASMMSLSRTSSAASVSSFDTQEEDISMTESFGMASALSRQELMEGIPTAADSMFANEAMVYPMIPPFERDDPPRRTRKRFSSAQLMMLEHLFHQTSHPTREQREFLAREANMCVLFTRFYRLTLFCSRVHIRVFHCVCVSVTDCPVTFFPLLIITFQSELRSVTVWFQNKRQTERKVALQSAAGGVGNSQVVSHLGAFSAFRRGPALIWRHYRHSIIVQLQLEWPFQEPERKREGEPWSLVISNGTNSPHARVPLSTFVKQRLTGEARARSRSQCSDTVPIVALPSRFSRGPDQAYTYGSSKSEAVSRSYRIACGAAHPDTRVAFPASPAQQIPTVAPFTTSQRNGCWRLEQRSAVGNLTIAHAPNLADSVPIGSFVVQFSVSGT